MRLTTRSSLFLKGLLGAFGVGVGVSAWAGVPPASITYGPDAQAVPLLSDLMMLTLVALVAVLAYRALRSGAAGRPLASIVALGIFVTGGGLSGRFESVALAVMASVNLNVAAGGSVNVGTFGSDVQVINQTPVAQRIKSVQATPPNSVGNPVSSPQCVPGTTVLQPAGSCYVFFIAG